MIHLYVKSKFQEIMSTLGGAEWVGLKQRVQFVKRCVVPIVLYGCEVWGGGGEMDRILDAFQRDLIRGLLGRKLEDRFRCFDLHRLAGWWPLSWEWRRRRLCFVSRIMNGNDDEVGMVKRVLGTRGVQRDGKWMKRRRGRWSSLLRWAGKDAEVLGLGIKVRVGEGGKRWVKANIVARDLICVWLRRGSALKKDIKERLLWKVEEWQKRERRRKCFKKLMVKGGFEFKPGMDV